VSVRLLVGDPAARLALLRRLVDLDLMGSVRVEHVGVEDPLLQWAGGPRGTAELATYDSLWVRLVDLPEALQARSWDAPCDLVVEVADATAPWNAGLWRIRAEEGAATVERTTAEPEILLDVSALGGAYLGGGNLVALLRAGLIEERRPGAVAELSRAMRTDLAPDAAMSF
jgi:predicted acetyltransferase